MTKKNLNIEPNFVMTFENAMFKLKYNLIVCHVLIVGVLRGK
jgi:hypothetical protein